ncbi:hypothetical protein [Microbacterium aurum]
MTLREFLTLLRRRWYTLVAAFAIAALATVFLVRDGGLYTSRTLVEFTLPGTATVARYNGIDDSSVIAFAKSVATQVNAGDSDTQYYSHIDAPIYGGGLREAVVITLRNEGSQWVSNIDTAVIEVQIVGRTEQWVQAQQAEAVARIDAAARSIQRLTNVPDEDLISLTVEPLTTQIFSIEPSRVAMVAAFGAMAMAAFIVGAAAAWLLDCSAGGIGIGRSGRRAREGIAS